MSGFAVIEPLQRESIEAWLRQDCPEPLTVFAAPETCDPPDHASDGAGESVPPARVVRLYRFKDFRFCAIGGWSFWRGDESPGHNIVPSHGRGDLNSAEVRQAFAVERLEEIPAAFILTHNPCETYGHFLLEMAPKLIVYNQIAQLCQALPILLSWYTPDYVVKWINILAPGAPVMRIPRSSVVHVRQPFFCDMLVWNYWPAAGFRHFLDCCIVYSLARPSVPSAEKIFISRKSRRSKKRDFRIWDNEDEVAAELAKLGFMIFEPEAHDLVDQIQIFHQAKMVVGELSSALHNTIFSCAGTVVVQVNPFNNVQTRLSKALGHRAVSILPESGTLYGWPPLPEGKQNFTVNLAAILAALG